MTEDIELGVRERIIQERRERERELVQADRAWLARSGGEQRALDRLDALVDELRVRAAEAKKPIPEALLDRIHEDAQEVERALRAVVEVTNARAELKQELARLNTEKEFKRRVREARRLAGLIEKAGNRGLGSEAAEVVLLQAGKPLHVNEITRRALEAGLIKTKAANPSQTISGYLNKGMGGDEPRFVRVEPGVFDLAERAVRA